MIAKLEWTQITESHYGINNQQLINNIRTYALERTAAKTTWGDKMHFIYLSIFQYVLNPEGDSDGYSGIPSAEGVS